MRRVVLILAVLAAPIAAQPRPIALSDYYRIEQIGSPAISPNGRWVAFVRSYIVEAENRRHSEVWLAAADGATAPRRITHPAFSSSDPRWSPDGTLLAFSSRRRASGSSGSETSVWFLRMDEPGGEAFQIPGVTEAPVFSPDNAWIAFTKPVPPQRDTTRVVARTPEERTMAERFTGKMYDWMNARFDGRGYLPDPRDPAATPPRELFVVPRSGGTPRAITALGVNVLDFDWAPDSRSLAFTANLSQRDEHQYERADLFVVELQGGAVKRLTDDGYNHGNVTFAPDGRTLVFTRQMGLTMVIARRQPMGAAVDVHTMPVTGGPMRNVTAQWDLIPRGLHYAPNGRLRFDADVSGMNHLFEVSPEGAVAQVTRGERRLSGFATAGTGDRIAYVATSPTQPGEIYAAQSDGTSERKLTAFHDTFTREVRLAGAERLSFRSKDGTVVEGWMLRPPGFDSARGPYPLILNVHGGPHGSYGNTFDFNFQLQAANGFVVVYTNPRGSTGYGEKFLWGTWGAWGDRDLEDVMAGVTHVQSRLPIDTKRLGITGYSYGGFMTDWAITQTKAFAAAISGAGISNWVSDYGTADIPRTKESEFFGTPWEPRGKEALIRQSPIFYAGNVVTPTMFIHGESDFRVPIEQAEQMYTALHKRKVPAKMVRYPDMYHGGWTPWNTVHRYWQELQWWQQWLGRPATTQ